MALISCVKLEISSSSCCCDTDCEQFYGYCTAVCDLLLDSEQFLMQWKGCIRFTYCKWLKNIKMFPIICLGVEYILYVNNDLIHFWSPLHLLPCYSASSDSSSLIHNPHPVQQTSPPLSPPHAISSSRIVHNRSV